ncbi:cobalt-precorrin-5B (C(1))-methyltransferase CbiD [Synechococcus elongatus]|uniref:cobalt-precorrin-5B (C(1))-methyltransferase CbiD n=1 Tax=Synechococcus elongatus TaxID=32046 RepID=UPI000F7ED086|nr:cobalt-precorrin-5B (C(1))-methyltransferase CbiD [Synechococcus elongatus]
MARSGYTLPVFACAAAIAALQRLRQPAASIQSVDCHLIDPDQTVAIAIEQVAPLSPDRALAICRSDPGDNLDLTRGTPIWAEVQLSRRSPDQGSLAIEAGEGIGHSETGPAIYDYAQRLLRANLLPLLQTHEQLTVRLILPEGRRLAERTANAAFGVVEGLSLLGTHGVAEALSAPEQLQVFRDRLRQLAADPDLVIFCIGENGLDLSQKIGLPRDRQLKTANWLGPLLVEAGLLGIPRILLFGYHGKLLKLAGSIFHTHHHVADARREILAAYAIAAGASVEQLRSLLDFPTVDAAAQYLDQTDPALAGRLWPQIAEAIANRSQAYIRRYSEQIPEIGVVLFGRDRQLLTASSQAQTWLTNRAIAQPLRYPSA